MAAKIIAFPAEASVPPARRRVNRAIRELSLLRPTQLSVRAHHYEPANPAKVAAIFARGYFEYVFNIWRKQKLMQMVNTYVHLIDPRNSNGPNCYGNDEQPEVDG